MVYKTPSPEELKAFEAKTAELKAQFRAGAITQDEYDRLYMEAVRETYYQEGAKK